MGYYYSASSSSTSTQENTVAISAKMRGGGVGGGADAASTGHDPAGSAADDVVFRDRQRGRGCHSCRRGSSGCWVDDGHNLHLSVAATATPARQVSVPIEGIKLENLPGLIGTTLASGMEVSPGGDDVLFVHGLLVVVTPLLSS